MVGKKFIVAYDGSPDSKKALEMAIDLANKVSAELFVVSVCEPFALGAGAIGEGAVYWDTEKEYKRVVEQKTETVRKYCEEKNLNVHAQVLTGHPVDEIIKYAQTEKADLIITGTRGHGGFARLLLGSVAHKLVTYSDIPVLVVK